jgi:hypothetical protein
MSYVESLHEVIKNRNWQDDGEKDWRRDGNDSECRHDLFTLNRFEGKEKSSEER